MWGRPSDPVETFEFRRLIRDTEYRLRATKKNNTMYIALFFNDEAIAVRIYVT